MSTEAISCLLAVTQCRLRPRLATSLFSSSSSSEEKAAENKKKVVNSPSNNIILVLMNVVVVVVRVTCCAVPVSLYLSLSRLGDGWPGEPAGPAPSG